MCNDYDAFAIVNEITSLAWLSSTI